MILIILSPQGPKEDYLTANSLFHDRTLIVGGLCYYVVIHGCVHPFPWFRLSLFLGSLGLGEPSRNIRRPPPVTGTVDSFNAVRSTGPIDYQRLSHFTTLAVAGGYLLKFIS